MHTTAETGQLQEQQVMITHTLQCTGIIQLISKYSLWMFTVASRLTVAAFTTEAFLVAGGTVHARFISRCSDLVGVGFGTEREINIFNW